MSTKNTEEIKDPMQEKELLYIPIVPGEAESVWIGLNGQSWNIPRGVQVEVPKPVAEIWHQSERAEAAARAAAMEEMAKASKIQGLG